jgi:hypothetical protein
VPGPPRKRDEPVDERGGRNLRLVFHGRTVTLSSSFQGLSSFVTLRIFG